MLTGLSVSKNRVTTIHNIFVVWKLQFYYVSSTDEADDKRGEINFSPFGFQFYYGSRERTQTTTTLLTPTTADETYEWHVDWSRTTTTGTT